MRLGTSMPQVIAYLLVMVWGAPWKENLLAKAYTEQQKNQ